MEEPSTPDKKRLISELIRGRDCTKKLQNLLRQRLVDGGSVSAEDLVIKILESFSDSLSTLSSCDSGVTDRKPAPGMKDRRGCYKRRKTEDSRVKIVDTTEDGYAWRKYGQKEILGAKYPRCYYRCTHKDEGCKALKQVQKLEDGSEMFHITYFGSHKCQNINKNTQLFSDSEDLSVFLLDFEDSKINHSSNSPSTITNVYITPSFEHGDDSNAKSGYYLASSNHDTSSNYAWKDMIGNLETSCADLSKDGISMDDFEFN